MNIPDSQLLTQFGLGGGVLILIVMGFISGKIVSGKVYERECSNSDDKDEIIRILAGGAEKAVDLAERRQGGTKGRHNAGT